MSTDTKLTPVHCEHNTHRITFHSAFTTAEFAIQRIRSNRKRQRKGPLSFVSAVLLLLLGFIHTSYGQTGGDSTALDLVFLIDGSGSISDADWTLQKSGISAALQDETSFPLDGSIAIGVVQWSFVNGMSTTRIEIPITNISDAQSRAGLVSEINAIAQIGASTNPGDGIRTGTEELMRTNRDSNWNLCMSTDGVLNAGESLASATAFAQASGVDRYSVIGIEDPGLATAQDLRNAYEPHVFGDGGVSIARNSTEFASLITGTCINEAIQVVGIEVTQSIQTLSNTIPLVADKTTVVRAFAEVPAGESARRVAPRLVGERGGSALPGSPLVADNTGGTVLIEESVIARRGDLSSSINFILPASWTSGSVTLRLDGGGTGLECLDQAAPVMNDCSATIDFISVSSPEIRYVGIPYRDSSGTLIEPSSSQLDEQAFRMLSLFPVPSINASKSRLLVATNGPPSLGAVNLRLSIARILDGCFSFLGCDRLYYGVLLGNANGGLANGIPGTVSSGYNQGVDNRTDVGFFRNVGGHEVGHSLGLHHAVDNTLPLNSNGRKVGYCSEVADAAAPGHPDFGPLSGANGNLPSAPLIGPLGDPQTEVWGIDTRFFRNDVNNLAVVDPNQTGALMGYCWVGSPQDAWTSAFEWQTLLSGLGSSSTSGTARSGQFLIVSGVVDSPTNNPTLTLGRTFRVDGEFPESSTGTYRAQLFDDTGTQLADVPFDGALSTGRPADPDADEGPQFLTFAVPVALPSAAIQRIEIHDTSGMVGMREASSNPPVASILQPTSGATLDSDSVMIRWTGSDTDGDELRYAVRYSSDNGSTWATLALDITDTEITVTRSALAASPQGLLEVIVTDGILSSSDRVELLTVSNNPPDLTLIKPEDGERFYSGLQNIFLEALALDPDAEAVELFWSSDVDGDIAVGNQISVRADELTEGTHVITVEAMDASGAATAASATIEVFRVAPAANDDDGTGGGTGTTGCLDSDGDGWGWDGTQTCIPDNGGDSMFQCVDSDGDGWGWNGVSSCLVGSPVQGACIDTDGDGWGWDGIGSCRVGQLVQGACIDTDGDGFGWDGIGSCIP